MTPDYRAIRGFNYQPGHSSHLQYTWTAFDADAWEREVPYAVRFGSNMLRIWLDWSAYLAVGEKMLNHMDRALEILDADGMTMMPVLFNRWNDTNYPAGGVTEANLRVAGWNFAPFMPYIDALAERFGDDDRIAVWDLCNEPQAPGPNADTALREYTWMARVGDRLRAKTAKPITIGTTVYDNVRMFAPLVDVITFHPYSREIGGMASLCEDHCRIAEEYDKPLICTETCVGSLDDEERGLLARDCIETLERFDIGWLAWQLCSGRFVTGSRERTDSNAVRPGEGYMPFVLPDGSTRPGHEWLERKNRE